MTRRRQAPSLLALVLASRLAGCQVDSAAVYDRLWLCDANGPPDLHRTGHGEPFLNGHVQPGLAFRQQHNLQIAPAP